ncbi:MAG TPA: SdrD B-like domain-containing protein, partial [Tepidisphaeraceae bacterium]
TGVYYHDANRNGSAETWEKGIAGDKIFIDKNDNGVRDRREPFAVTQVDGSFSFKALPPGDYKLRRELPTGWLQTSDPLNVTLASGQKLRGLTLGAAPLSTKGSIQGKSFNDSNANGTLDAGDVPAIAKTIFLDRDNDGVLDAGERRTTTKSDGSFGFDNLDAGIYHVRRVFPSGFTYSTTKIDLTLSPGENEVGLLIGGKTV